MTDGAPLSPTAPLRRVRDCLDSAVRALAPLPDAAPRLEAELLLAEATGWPRTRLIAWPDLMLDPDSSARFDVLLARRAAGEPMAYIRGRQAFWTLDLRVTADTLIPRPETELLVELALALPDPDRPRVVADLGTGSGAVAAALASERPGWTLVASDRSPAALRVAGRNLRTLEFRNAYPLLGDWLSPLAAGALDVILANPPYIAEGDPHLTRGDPRHEPPAALVSGPDGLDAIRAIAADAMRCLRPGGLLAVEHGCEQGAAVRALFRARGLDAPETRLDLAGHERVTLGWCATPPSPRDDPATPVRPSR